MTRGTPDLLENSLTLLYLRRNFTTLRRREKPNIDNALQDSRCWNLRVGNRIPDSESASLRMRILDGNGVARDSDVLLVSFCDLLNEGRDLRLPTESAELTARSTADLCRWDIIGSSDPVGSARDAIPISVILIRMG